MTAQVKEDEQTKVVEVAHLVRQAKENKPINQTTMQITENGVSVSEPSLAGKEVEVKLDGKTYKAIIQ